MGILWRVQTKIMMIKYIENVWSMFLVLCFLKLYLSILRNYSQEQYYNRFENQKFVWYVFFTLFSLMFSFDFDFSYCKF